MLFGLPFHILHRSGNNGLNSGQLLIDLEPSAFKPGEFQQVFYQLGESVAGLIDFPEIIKLLVISEPILKAQCRGTEALNRGQGSAQFVGNIGQKLCLQAIRLTQSSHSAGLLVKSGILHGNGRLVCQRSKQSHAS